MAQTQRYTVRRCDEGGTLSRPDGTPVDHTWDVVDRETDRAVENRDTRKQARDAARDRNAAQKG